jgi:hypothetical protein
LEDDSLSARRGVHFGDYRLHRGVVKLLINAELVDVARLDLLRHRHGDADPSFK